MKAENHNYFALRRLHSLFGIFPIGVFLLEHFFSNSFAFQGAAKFNSLVETFQSLWITPYLEVGLIALPILFHAVFGLVITFTGSNNFIAYGWYRNWMYFFQRVTGIVVLAFVIVHVWGTRLSFIGSGRHITFDDMRLLFTPAWAKAFYIVGILAAVYHFSNGIATALMTWGVTVSQRSQKIVAVAAWGLFVFMGVWGLLILKAFI